MSYMFFGSIFNGDISKWSVSNVTHMRGILANCSTDRVTYWAKIEHFETRRKAVLNYQEPIKDKQQLNKLISDTRNSREIYKI